MRDTEIQDPLMRLHSAAIAAAMEPKTPVPKPWPKCTAAWAESFAKVMGEGVAGRPDVRPAPVVQIGDAPHKPIHIGVDVSHSADAIAYAMRAYMGGRGGGKMHQTVKELRDLLQGNGDGVVGFKFKPGSFVAVNEAGDGFVGVDHGVDAASYMFAGIDKHKAKLAAASYMFAGIDKHKAKLASESLRQLLNPPGHKPALVASPYPPRKPGEFFPGDRVYSPGACLTDLLLVRKTSSGTWLADNERGLTVVVFASRIKLLDRKPDVS